jgi:DNA-directed RNA polymerase subunit M/transcription elongation factor TFIIS
METNIQYKKCPDCNGAIFNEQTLYHDDCLELIVFCDDCGKTWSEVYKFIKNEVEENNG